MESKANKNSHVLMFGLSFNLIVTFGPIDSRATLCIDYTCVQQQFNSIHCLHTYQLENSVIVEPTSTNLRPSVNHKRKRMSSKELLIGHLCAANVAASA